jgi:hypothetical protein
MACINKTSPKIALLLIALAVFFGAGLPVFLYSQHPAEAQQRVFRDIQTSTLPAATYVDTRVLAANTAKTVTVPTGYSVANFASAACSFWVRVGGAAAVPAADVTNGSGSALNPDRRRFVAGSTFSIVSGTTCTVSMEWYNAGG